ncbi:MAG: HDOD domain-containing protein [Treponemataceae bacterium]|nr:HDOD domain-containing protein [Treponemataceae bacterium]
MSELASKVVDSSKIRKAVQSHIPLSITTYTLPHEMSDYMAQVLTEFLKELNQEHMTEYLVYCLNELITNAKKANTKRVYFAAKHLDIHNKNDYEEGLKTFKADTLDNIRYYLSMQKDAGYYIKFIMQNSADKLKLEVRNNAELTVFEYKRIHDKVVRANEYTSMDQAFEEIIDDSEGAGLGLIIMILMLRKIGLTEDNYQVLCENGETICRLVLPFSKNTVQTYSDLAEQILPMIEEVPPFPENISTINAMLNNPDVKLSEIAAQISSDVSLTADLLKLVNSAAFSLQKQCTSIAESVKLVGLRGIRNLLYSVGTISSLGGSEADAKVLWDHSAKVAFYAYNLSRNFFPFKREVIEDSYVCGLLHDMGKIIFQTAHPNMLEHFQRICREKSTDKLFFEKISAGMNHSEIGARIAEKWSFPEVITSTIRYHHDPMEAPQKFRNTASVVYLADMLCRYQDGEVEFYQFDPMVLAAFSIRNEEHLKVLAAKLSKSYSKEH